MIQPQLQEELPIEELPIPIHLQQITLPPTIHQQQTSPRQAPPLTLVPLHLLRLSRRPVPCPPIARSRLPSLPMAIPASWSTSTTDNLWPMTRSAPTLAAR